MLVHNGTCSHLADLRGRQIALEQLLVKLLQGSAANNIKRINDVAYKSH